MKTTLECLPCFVKQALRTARIASSSPETHEKVMRACLNYLRAIPMEASPPENSVGLYQLIADICGCPDPFSELKRESNQFAMRLLPQVRQQITAADDPLRAALHFSIAGNIIDYGALHDFDMGGTIRRALNAPLAIDHYQKLRRAIDDARTILYLADNSGELVFDSLVIEQLGKPVTLAVKDGPIINDALYADAQACGLDRACRIVSNGTRCPGTPLASCSEEFLDIFRQADLIISKGQGNFETLSEASAPLFFLLTVKCPIVGAQIYRISGTQVTTGAMVLLGVDAALA